VLFTKTAYSQACHFSHIQLFKTAVLDNYLFSASDNITCNLQMSLIRVTKLEEFWQIPTLGVFTLSNKAIVLKRRFNSIAWKWRKPREKKPQETIPASEESFPIASKSLIEFVEVLLLSHHTILGDLKTYVIINCCLTTRYDIRLKCQHETNKAIAKHNENPCEKDDLFRYSQIPWRVLEALQERKRNHEQSIGACHPAVE